jgi:Holliday junction DNA helicase RuvA
MLKKIEATLLDYDNENAVIKCNSITLEAFPSFRVLKNLNIGEKYDFYAHFEMNEWNMTLFIFFDSFERKMFTNLKKVSKIGPKTAAKILRTNDSEKIASMISAQDVKGLTSLPGIGAKTAERIISELKNNFETIDLEVKTESFSDALDALEQLGFERSKVYKIIKMENISNLDTQDIIKFILSKM